jgi:hypothetical protein
MPQIPEKRRFVNHGVQAWLAKVDTGSGRRKFKR